MPAWWSAARPTTISPFVTAEPFRIGVLGHGTVGSAFAGLLEERADAIDAEVGRRPEISGVLTRSRGDFDDILDRSDLIVELMLSLIHI